MDAFLNLRHAGLNGNAVSAIFDKHIAIDEAKSHSEQTIFDQGKGMETIIPNLENESNDTRELEFEIDKTNIKVECEDYNTIHVEEDTLNRAIKTEPRYRTEEAESETFPNYACNSEYLSNKHPGSILRSLLSNDADPRSLLKNYAEISGTVFLQNKQNRKVFSLNEGSCVFVTELNLPQLEFSRGGLKRETKESEPEEFKFDAEKESECNDVLTMKDDPKLFSECYVVCKKLDVAIKNEEERKKEEKD